MIIIKKSCYFLFALLLIGCNSAPESTQPNIVLIVSDDQRADTLDQMPTLMELADEGALFTSAYVTTPLCCPSRCSILTGEYAHNHGVYNNRPPSGFIAFKDDQTLATWLSEAGYETALIGKYLNGYNANTSDYVPPGWDTFLAFVRGPAYYDYSLKNFVQGIDQGLLEYGKEPEAYSTDVLAQHAVDFIESTEGQDEQPFFLYFTPYGPHTPATPPERYEDLPLEGDFNPPSYNEEDVSDKAEWIQALNSLGKKRTEEITGYRQKQQGALLAIDDAIATLLETLKARGELENTIIIYMGDNGLQWGEHRIVLEKSAPYEESIKVPLLVYDGRRTQGEVVNDFILNIDLAPTLLEWAGLTIPDSIDGKSFAALLAGEDYEERSDFLVESWREEGKGFTAVHEKEWVYILWETGEEELYNLSEDPYQLESVLSDPENQDKLIELQSRLETLQTCKGETSCY